MYQRHAKSQFVQYFVRKTLVFVYWNGKNNPPILPGEQKKCVKSWHSNRKLYNDMDIIGGKNAEKMNEAIETAVELIKG